MKPLLFIVILIFTLHYSLAQTAADYHLPLCVGNYLKFYTPDGSGGGWEARTTFHSIVRADSINGEIFYLQKGYEVLDVNSTDTNVFHDFWLRKDASGDILIGAYDLTGTGTLDSATVAPPGSVYFSNQFLAPGYSQTYSMGVGITSTDSVISISATAGIYTKCIQIRRMRKLNGIVDMMEDFFYAYQMGMVRSERFVPANQIHDNNIVDFKVINCISTGNSDGLENKREISFYPNPASGFVIFNCDDISSTTATLNIYTGIGELIKSEKLITNRQKINIDDLNNGIYVAEIKSKEWSKKETLIIQR